jgi:DNA-binding transcriptional LysR family regulator
MLDLRRLKAFREVAARRSFSAAAEALDYTQSSVSQQVMALEQELGVSLLDRAERPVRATPAGELVLGRAEELIARAEAIEAELRALSGGDLGTLRVGGFSTAWTTFLPAAVAAFSREHPKVELELDLLEPEPALHALRRGDLDLAVVYLFPEKTGPLDERIEAFHLLDDPYALVLPAGHRLAKRRGLKFADLAEERWISPPASAPYSQTLHDLLREHGGFTPQAHETRDIAMAQPLIATGLAVGLLPAMSLVQRHPGVVVRSLPDGPMARSVWALRMARRRTPSDEAMIAAISKEAAKL